MTKFNKEELISSEVERISKRYNKDYLELNDIMEITGLGRDKVRTLFNSKNFPTCKIGKKKTVTIMGFVIWQMEHNTGGNIYG